MPQTPPPSDSSHALLVSNFFRWQADGNYVLLERHWSAQFHQGQIVVKCARHIVGVHKNLLNLQRHFRLRLFIFRHVIVAQPNRETGGESVEKLRMNM